MPLCNKCQKLGYCEALAAINKNGLTTDSTINSKQGIANLFITTPDEVSVINDEIEILKRDHEAFVEIQREIAKLRVCPNLADFP